MLDLSHLWGKGQFLTFIAEISSATVTNHLFDLALGHHSGLVCNASCPAPLKFNVNGVL